MKKGIGPVVAVIGVAIVLIVLTVAFVAGSMFGRQHAEKKYLFEATLISQSDEVETYVRSFQRATDLSFLQSIHDSGSESIVLPYDFDAKYSSRHNLSYWQIYNDKQIPPKEIMKNKLRQKISWVSSCYLDDYYDAYQDFAADSGFDMTFSDISLLNVNEFTDNKISVDSTNEMTFHRIHTLEDQEIDMTRTFTPYSKLETEFGRIIEVAEDIITNDNIGSCVRGETAICFQDEFNRKNANEALKELALSLSATYNVVVNLTIPTDNDYKSTGPRAIVNVSIYEDNRNYTFYYFPDDTVKIGFIGVNFLAKVGTKIGVLEDYWEQIKADSHSNFRDCKVGLGYSGFGIISPKDRVDICKFFTVTPTVCDDPDGINYLTAGVCTDFTGSYSDMCFDLDDVDGDETLYEYYCHASGICHYEEKSCGGKCIGGACIPICYNDADCDDDNPCTGVEAEGGIDKCRNPGDVDAYCDWPNLRLGYVPPNTDGIWGTVDDCDRTMKSCPNLGDCTQNCQAVGNTWMCDGPPNKECPNECKGDGTCNGCTPPACTQEDCGCADDTYCTAKYGPNYKCKLSTHECVLDECDSDLDCKDPKTVCQYWACHRPDDPDSECILHNWHDGYIPAGNACGETERPCPGKCEASQEYRDPEKNIEKCSIECDGSGNCKASCTPPDCSYTSIIECKYGCKDGMNCWYGYFCPSKTCEDTCCWPCIGTKCTTLEGCIREDMSPPTCPWEDRWADITCSCPPGAWCRWPCCIMDKICEATCYYSDICTYIS